MALIPQRVDEADAGRVNVEHADAIAACGAEAVHDIRRHREERAGLDADPLSVLKELDVALEDVEGVRVIGVGVGVDALESRLESELDHLEVRQLAEDAPAAEAAVELLALARPGDVRLLVHCRRS